MHIAALSITNYRNFSSVGLSELPPALVVVGENNAGKTNFLRAIQLVLDTGIPDRSRQLERDDFWLGCQAPMCGDEIAISVDLSGYDGDVRVKAALADCSVSVSPLTARITYRFHPELSTTGEILGYTWLIYGGDDATNELTPSRRREIALTVLPPLRDAEASLRGWRGSPLYDLTRLLDVDDEDLGAVAQAVADANDHLRELDEIKEMEDHLVTRVRDMVGANFGVDVTLGVASPEPDELLRMLRLLVDGGYPIQHTGTGAANVILLPVLLERLGAQRAGHHLADAVLAVEEPEAHLHPQVQRVLFRYLIETTALMVTTHSAHIASVAPLPTIVMLRAGKSTSEARRAISAEMTTDQVADLERYLDVNRADVLFARGVILVEGAAEKYLVPVAAFANGIDLDRLGISVCSVEGTDFVPYRRLLTQLEIPHVVLTDGDVDTKGRQVGLRRGATLLGGDTAPKLLAEEKWTELRDLLREHGIFVNESTLELEYADTAGDAMQAAHDQFHESEKTNSDGRGACGIDRP